MCALGFIIFGFRGTHNHVREARSSMASAGNSFILLSSRFLVGQDDICVQGMLAEAVSV